VPGVWERNGRKFWYMNQRDLSVIESVERPGGQESEHP
jgi:hypothetical protein